MWALKFSFVTLLVITFILWWEVTFVKAIGDSSLGIVIPAGEEQCFYQEFLISENVWIDYAVVGSSLGGMDINFQFSDPDGRPLITEFKKSLSSAL
jgi:hypothetical protein